MATSTPASAVGQRGGVVDVAVRRCAGPVVVVGVPGHRAHLVARVGQGRHQPTADESGGAGDEDGGHGSHPRRAPTMCGFTRSCSNLVLQQPRQSCRGLPRRSHHVHGVATAPLIDEARLLLPAAGGTAWRDTPVSDVAVTSASPVSFVFDDLKLPADLVSVLAAQGITDPDPDPGRDAARLARRPRRARPGPHRLRQDLRVPAAARRPPRPSRGCRPCRASRAR